MGDEVDMQGLEFFEREDELLRAASKAVKTLDYDDVEQATPSICHERI